MKRSLRLTLAAAFVLLVMAVSTAAASAAVYIPTKTADTADGACNADCSLREAVLAANAKPGDDVILLRPGVYLLSLAGNENLGATGDLDVQDDLVIVGSGASSTIIDGDGIDRLFEVPSGLTLELRDVTLRNGRAQTGGAILNQGETTILRSVLSGNFSTAGFGGAILTNGQNASLNVADSTLASNTAQGGGGAIAAGGEVELDNLTVSGNRSVADHGGGLYVFADARTAVNNATIVANTAGLSGGGIFAEVSAFVGFPPSVTNSIVAGNTAATSPDCAGDLESGYDLIGNGAGCLGPSAARHDLVGTPASPINPLVAPLAQNGGPTPTRALAAGSPALNAGHPGTPGSGGDACAATDQRDASRPASNRCDIGAFEVTPACVSGGSTICLGQNRFKVTATWRKGLTALGATLSNESGYFYFSSPGDVELTVKILNTCAANGYYRFSAGGMTNLRVDITVTDTKTGATRTYRNPAGQPFRAIIDPSAFACP
ncbi:MAG TPA: CSLREA domain-containing protein [Thermoanaerobaculia bacterium]|jgi:CSLREA domain-containing protein